MYSIMKVIVLLVLTSFVVVKATPFAQQEHEFSMDATPSMIRGGNMGMEEFDAHGRQLFSSGSWSWSNLLFHIGVCHAHNDCPNKPHPGPCGCPDCNKPHPPHFQNSYCENLSAATSEVNEEDVADEDRTTGENGTNGAGQTGSSMFTWVWVAAAAAACAVVGAAVMRKRNVDGEGSAREVSAEAAEGGDYKLMGGMSAAIAGVMMKMGLRPSSPSESGSVVSGNSGAVSKRLSLLQNGADVTPMAAPAPKPSFIEIQNDLDYSHDMVECDESVEVEGPYRPSSQYAL